MAFFVAEGNKYASLWIPSSPSTIRICSPSLKECIPAPDSQSTHTAESRLRWGRGTAASEATWSLPSQSGGSSERDKEKEAMDKHKY